MHGPFAATGALVTFGLAEWMHGSGFLAVYVAGLLVGNRETRAHNTIVTFLDAATWLAQIAMFVLLGLLAWPERLPQRLLAALVVALTLMLIARPVAVLACLAPFRFSFREKLFVSWVGLRGAVSVFLAAIPMLVGLKGAYFYFDVAFVVVMLSLAIQGWTIAVAARFLRIGLPRIDVNAHRTELDLPGTLKHELVGYPVAADSPYLRRGIAPSWAKLMLVVRSERVNTPEEAGPVRAGDQVYYLAPPDRVQALDRFFAERTQVSPDAALVEDFFVPGEVTLGALAEIYGLAVPPEDAGTALADYFAAYFIKHPPRPNDTIPLGPVRLVAHTVTADRVVTVGLQLAEAEPEPRGFADRMWRKLRRALRRLAARMRRPKG
jgi:cell volume regulation protein A